MLSNLWGADLIALLRTCVSLPFVLLLLIVGQVSTAAADSIRGFILIESMQVYLLPLPKQTDAKRLSVSTSFQLRSSLLDLKTGDYVVLDGKLSDSDRDGQTDEVVVDGIESVGLSDLIGTWRSPKWQVVHFENFNSLTLYRPKFPAPARQSGFVDLTKFKDLSYSLAPELGTSYSIFLVEKHAASGTRGAVYVGRLKLQNEAVTTLTLEIFDPKTGKSNEVISLSPVRD